jgi:hypothetical protein
MPDINIAREPAINQAAQNKCDRLGTVIIGGAGGWETCLALPAWWGCPLLGGVVSLRRAVPPTAGHFTSLLGVGAGLVGLGGGRRVPARIFSLRSGRVSLPAWGGSTSVWGRAAGKFFVSPLPPLWVGVSSLRGAVDGAVLCRSPSLRAAGQPPCGGGRRVNFSSLPSPALGRAYSSLRGAVDGAVLCRSPSLRAAGQPPCGGGRRVSLFRLALPSQRRAVPSLRRGILHLRTAGGAGGACGTCRSGGLSRRWLRRFLWLQAVLSYINFAEDE